LHHFLRLHLGFLSSSNPFPPTIRRIVPHKVKGKGLGLPLDFFPLGSGIVIGRMYFCLCKDRRLIADNTIRHVPCDTSNPHIRDLHLLSGPPYGGRCVACGPLRRIRQPKHQCFSLRKPPIHRKGGGSSCECSARRLRLPVVCVKFV